MDLYFYSNMIRNIFATFFQDGIWVIGFFYLLNKTFESEKLIKLSKVVIIVVLAFLLIYSIFVSI
ncbi:hypothetical protein UP17_25315 (plasmid) [Peribacillus simplex]|nr:hypothetical protein UP17_25315 [Peribacillus simplex]